MIGAAGAALALAGAGIAFAVKGVRDEPATPRATTLVQPSPNAPKWAAVGVLAPTFLEDEAAELTARIAAAGFTTEPVNTVLGGFRPTSIRYYEGRGRGGHAAGQVARQVRRRFLPDVEEVERTSECLSFACPPPILIFLGMDPSSRVGEHPTIVQEAPRPLRNVERGSPYWGVYILISNRAEAVSAAARLNEMGVAVSHGEVSCDRRLRVWLRPDGPPGTHRVAAYFYSRVEALAFAAALDPPPLGVARTPVDCGV
jgi:hypothetical protein